VHKGAKWKQSQIYSKQQSKQRKESYNKNRMIESIPNNYQNKGMTDTILQPKRGLDLAHQIEEKKNQNNNFKMKKIKAHEPF
jgi:hypothetical protein